MNLNTLTTLKGHYMLHANQSINFIDNDTEELFKYNMKHNKNLMIDSGWDKKEITYKFNNNGFRCNDFDDYSDSIMFLGCSHTVGVGLPLEETWAYLVAKELGLTNYNLGQGGGSMDTCYRLGDHWIPILKPKIIVVLKTELVRMECLHLDWIEYFGTWTNTLKFYSNNKSKFYEDWIETDNNGILNSAKNEYALRYIAAQHNIKIIVKSAIEYGFNNSVIIGIDKDNKDKSLIQYTARDLKHRGEHHNKKFAQTILKAVNSND